VRRCVGRCVGPTRASVDSAAHNPGIGASEPRNRRVQDASRSRESEDGNRRSTVRRSSGMRCRPQKSHSNRSLSCDRLCIDLRATLISIWHNEPIPPPPGSRPAGPKRGTRTWSPARPVVRSRMKQNGQPRRTSPGPNRGRRHRPRHRPDWLITGDQLEPRRRSRGGVVAPVPGRSGGPVLGLLVSNLSGTALDFE
jgi:hypothetical protein